MLAFAAQLPVNVVENGTQELQHATQRVFQIVRMQHRVTHQSVTTPAQCVAVEAKELVVHQVGQSRPQSRKGQRRHTGSRRIQQFRRDSSVLEDGRHIEIPLCRHENCLTYQADRGCALVLSVIHGQAHPQKVY